MPSSVPGWAKVELDGGVRGTIRRTEFAHEAPTDMTNAVEIGEVLRAEVLEIDRSHREVKLSAKRLLPPPYIAFKNSHFVGQKVAGIVTNTIPSFAFVRLPGGVDGSIHVRNQATGFVAHPDQVVTKGQTLHPVIIGFDDDRKRVNLSLTAQTSADTPSASQPAPPSVRPAAARPMMPPATRPSRPSGGPPAFRPTPPSEEAGTPPRWQSPPVQPAARRPARRTATAEGNTVDEAVSVECGKLRVQPRQVRVDVLDEGKRGLFGPVKQMAKVRGHRT
jgi:predicted RNA-binding protein with RPS1 domain